MGVGATGFGGGGAGTGFGGGGGATGLGGAGITGFGGTIIGLIIGATVGQLTGLAFLGKQRISAASSVEKNNSGYFTAIITKIKENPLMLSIIVQNNIVPLIFAVAKASAPDFPVLGRGATKAFGKIDKILLAILYELLPILMTAFCAVAATCPAFVAS